MVSLLGRNAVGRKGEGGVWPGGPARRWSTLTVLSGIVLFPVGYASPHFSGLPASGYRLFSVLFLPWAVLALIAVGAVLLWLVEWRLLPWRKNARAVLRDQRRSIVEHLERTQRIALGVGVMLWGAVWFVPWGALTGGGGLHGGVFSPQLEPWTLWLCLVSAWVWVLRSDRALLRLEARTVGRCRWCLHEVDPGVMLCPECGGDQRIRPVT